MFKWKVGTRSKIKFWKDIWRGKEDLKSTFSRLFSLAIDKDISIMDMISR